MQCSDTFFNEYIGHEGAYQPYQPLHAFSPQKALRVLKQRPGADCYTFISQNKLRVLKYDPRPTTAPLAPKRA